MDIKKQFLFFMILLIGATAGCELICKRAEERQQDPGAPAEKTATKTEQQTRQQASDFTLTDVNGRSHTLSSYRGKVVLLNFFATWCPSCVVKIPELNKIHQLYDRDDFVLVAVNIQESSKKIQQFVNSKKINYTVLLDTKAEVARAYGVRGIPTNALIDKKGNLRFIDHILPARELIESLITEKPGN